jgi:hypothetical protein
MCRVKNPPRGTGRIGVLLWRSDAVAQRKPSSPRSTIHDSHTNDPGFVKLGHAFSKVASEVGGRGQWEGMSCTIGFWSREKNKQYNSNTGVVAMSGSRTSGIRIVVGIRLLPCVMSVNVSSQSSKCNMVLGPRNRLKLASQTA